MPWNDNVASQSTIPSLEQLDPWDPRWEQAFEVKMASKTQQRRDRNEDSDSIYSDDVEFVTLVDGTDPDADSCFDDGPKKADPKAGIARRWKTGFVSGGGPSLTSAFTPVLLDSASELLQRELYIPIVTYHDDLALHVDSKLEPQVQHVAETPAPLHALPGGTVVPLSHNGPQAQRQGGTAMPPPLPIVWEKAPKELPAFVLPSPKPET